ncbi:hypothetical protein BCR34DRAFT_603416 [Clohesyomyces aquaticus]|uniref:Uncharacterized protein n=1 Tax=Clohesyomyces aquaticus TaxID=1231657 RepID=A0A1Y1ZEL0_9PLEO|nr:hypothetical protein BCR34DRAFT_603416 [Clohesyomyces aquaticus]
MKTYFLILALLVALGLSLPTDDVLKDMSIESGTPGQLQTFTAIAPLTSNTVTGESMINTGNPGSGSATEARALLDMTIGIAISAGGTLAGVHKDIYDVVYRRLNNTLCKAGRDPWCLKSSREARISITDGQNDFVSVWVENSFFQNNETRRLLIGSVAGTVQKWFLEPKNCYKLAPGATVQQCCVPGFVGVNVYGTGNQLDVHFEYSRGKLENLPPAGNEGCKNMLEQAKDKIGELVPYWKTELQTAVVNTDVHCMDP